MGLLTIAVIIILSYLLVIFVFLFIHFIIVIIIFVLFYLKTLSYMQSLRLAPAGRTHCWYTDLLLFNPLFGLVQE